MTTPIQELIRLWKEQQKEAPIALKGMYRLFIKDAEEMLEKEKEVMSEIYADGGDWDEVPQPRFENYYNQTFEPIER